VIMITLFMEGSSNDKNGNLRQGFGKLFEQKLKGKMPKIILGDDKHSTIRKFNADKLSEKKLILIDLDASEEDRDSELTKLGLDKAHAFFMIQELEAWFISQSEILDSYYSTDIKSKIQTKDPKAISNPSDLLIQLTKKTKKGEYHKVKHATDLLKKLNLGNLERDFDDVKNLIGENP
jgi:hypothetical protein